MIVLVPLAVAQDAPAISPDYTVEIDNAWVRVLRVKHEPRVRIGLHRHPATVVIALTDIHEKITGVDGRVSMVDYPAGSVRFAEAGQHLEENVGGQTMEAAIIELKPGASKSAPVTLDPVKLDPQHHVVVFENDRVRVIRTILPPHVRSPMHQHPHYVVVYLTELHTSMKLGDGSVVDNPRHAGEIAWRDALEHQTEQMGDKTAAEIQVELK